MRLRDADRIVTFYTLERGKLSAVAKGVRRVRSRVGGRLEPFSLVHVVLHQGRGSLYTLIGAETIRTFQGVRDSLLRMDEGARLLEAVRRLFPEEEGSPASFNLIVRCLAKLAAAPDRAAAARLVLATRLKLLDTLGYLPELDVCLRCGCRADVYGFDPMLGGVVCTECFSQGIPGGFGLSEPGLQEVRLLLQTPLSELLESIPPLQGMVTLDAERIISGVLSHHGH